MPVEYLQRVTICNMEDTEYFDIEFEEPRSPDERDSWLGWKHDDNGPLSVVIPERHAPDFDPHAMFIVGSLDGEVKVNSRIYGSNETENMVTGIKLIEYRVDL